MKKLMFPTMAMVLLVAGCAKEKKYDKIYKVESVSKALISTDPKDPYIYVPTVENTPMNVTASRPFWSGDQKLVTFRFTEKSLEVLELPSEVDQNPADGAQFSDNLNNFSPVVSIDIDHKDYRCAKDQYDECSNKEEEVDDRHWTKKRFFKPDFTSLSVDETNTLPEQLTNLFEKCFSESAKVVKNIDITQDSVNFTIEKTMKAGIECADVQSFDDLRNLSFKVTHHYSFVKKSKLVSPSYKGVLYPNTDQNTFGFFTTKTKKLTSDNRVTEDSDKTYMNRWNPDRGEIVYYLNEDFFKPKYKRILDSTRQAVETINQSFKRAGSSLKIKLEDGTGKAVGDLRNSFIVLVPDPQASGVIGYGPSIANPANGEIVKGQVIMYYGTMVKYIQSTYDELIAQAKVAQSNSQTPAAQVARDIIVEGKPVQVDAKLAKSFEASMNLLERRNNIVVGKEVHSVVRDGGFTNSSIHDHGKEILQNNSKLAYNGISDLVKRIKATQEDLSSVTDPSEKLEKQLALNDLYTEINSRECYYDQSLVGWSDAVLTGLDISVKDAAKLKPWNDLSESEKQKFIDKILPSVWVSTLVHEVGHTLGLRHNFNGSEDKDNFYSKQEQSALGLDRAPIFSSIMDYAPSSLNELTVMGKYDIAALRFAYARKVELKNGKLMSVTKPLGDMSKESLDQLKDYKYCTDEHVSVNAGCKRHDEGTNLTEIANHFITQYDKNYEKRNNRNKRLDFSGVTDLDYYQAQRYTFNGLRVIFEVYDRVAGMFASELQKDPTLWDTIEWLKDLKQATVLAGNFYLRVLKTPSLHCIVLNAKTGKLAAILPIENISKDSISCFDIKLNEAYKMVGETGRHLNNARSETLRGDIKADPSQISIRGIWMDKFLSIDFLTKREMGISTFDDYRTSFFDHAPFKTEIQKVLTGMVSGAIEAYPDVRLADGSVVTLDDIITRAPEQKGTPIPFNIGNTHLIKKSFDYRVRGLFPRAEVDLRELVLPIAKARLLNSEDQINSVGFAKNLSVTKLSASSVITEAIGAVAEFLDQSGNSVARFAALKSNKLAIDIIKERESMLKDVTLGEALSKLDAALIEKIAIARIGGESRSCEVVAPVPAPTEPTEPSEPTTPAQTVEPVPKEECIIWEAPLEKVVAFLNQELPTSKEANDDVLKLLDIMAK